MKKFIEEFKKFAMKGNVLDLAIGVIIGSAFGKIVTSLVNDIIMPLIGILTGGINFSYLKFTLKSYIGNAEPVVLNIESFLNNIIDFLIIAFSIFIFIKLINKFRVENKKEDYRKKASDELKVLNEIRDILKKDNKIKEEDYHNFRGER